MLVRIIMRNKKVVKILCVIQSSDAGLSGGCAGIGAAALRRSENDAECSRNFGRGFCAECR